MSCYTLHNSQSETLVHFCLVTLCIPVQLHLMHMSAHLIHWCMPVLLHFARQPIGDPGVFLSSYTLHSCLGTLKVHDSISNTLVHACLVTLCISCIPVQVHLMQILVNSTSWHISVQLHLMFMTAQLTHWCMPVQLPFAFLPSYTKAARQPIPQHGVFLSYSYTFHSCVTTHNVCSSSFHLLVYSYLATALHFCLATPNVHGSSSHRLVHSYLVPKCIPVQWHSQNVPHSGVLSTFINQEHIKTDKFHMQQIRIVHFVKSLKKTSIIFYFIVKSLKLLDRKNLNILNGMRKTGNFQRLCCVKSQHRPNSWHGLFLKLLKLKQNCQNNIRSIV